MRIDDAATQAMLPLPPATFHILVALSSGDRHGYGIIQDVEARTNGELRLSAGTLYRTIQRLLEQGLISEQARLVRGDDPRRRYYRITKLGTAVVRADAERLAQMVSLARDAGLIEGTS
jgi:DNA-binding PadR family transcriptional regulator